MSEAGDIWERYDAKVVQIQQLEARIAELERDVALGKHERDHWARVARQLNKKLQVARSLAERLREAQLDPEASTSTAAPRQEEAYDVDELAGLRLEFDRAREVLGLVLSALSRALDDDDAEVAELSRRLRHHAGGKLLYSITRGSLTLVPVDGRYLVDRTWLSRLDLGALRAELDVAAQSGIYAQPENAAIVASEPPMPRPELKARLSEIDRTAPLPTFRPPAAPGASEPDFSVELEDDLDAYADDGSDLPPPPPMPATQLFIPPPPLLPALPADDPKPVRPAEPRTEEARRAGEPKPGRATEPPVRVDETIRGVPSSTLPGGLIPNLQIGRLIKTPGGG